MKPTTWYYNRAVQFNMLEGMKNREIFLKDFSEEKYHIRPLNIFTTQGIEYMTQRFQFKERNYHIFHSVATLDHSKLPKTPTDLTELEAVREEYNDKFEGAMVGYDYVIDIDNDLVDHEGNAVQRNTLIKSLREKHGWTVAQAKEWMKEKKEAGEIRDLFEASLLQSRETAIKIHEEFLSMKLPFYFTFSGSKGFHFRIPWKWVHGVVDVDPKDFVEVSKTITRNLIRDLSLEQVDMKVYDIRRVLRVPYSIHPKTGYVCLPCNSLHLFHFKVSKFEAESVLNSRDDPLYDGKRSRGYFPHEQEGELREFLRTYGEI